MKKIIQKVRVGLLVVGAIASLGSFFVTHNVQAAPVGFVTTWKTDNPGVSNSDQITIPTLQTETYNYDVDWGDSSTSTGQTGDATHTYTSPGTYTVTITGTFPRIYFNNGGTTDAAKILSVEHWGTNHWSSMEASFAGCVNLIINATDAPDLSGVTSTRYMFLNATTINQDLSSWDVSSVTDMYGMFQSATSFNQDVSDWDVSHVVDMGYMFENATVFNNGGQPLDWGIKTGSVVTMNSMFLFASSFNQDVSDWDVSSVGNMGHMFHDATSFNNGGQPLDWGIKTGSVTIMSDMFNGAAVFNQAVNSWDTSSVTNMYYMFQAASSFNQPVNNWDVSHVTDMNNMFADAQSFNQDVSDWDISSITSTPNMFGGASSFNNGGQPMDWGNKTSNLVSLYSMFDRAVSFNQDISGWNTSQVTSMSYMLNQTASFDQDLSAWDVSRVTDMSSMLTGSGLSVTNYDAILHAWSQQSVQTGVALDVSASYCHASDSRDVLTGTYNWVIVDGGQQTGCNVATSVTTTPTVSVGRSTPWGVGLMPTTQSLVQPLESKHYFSRTLKQGMKGDDVVALQKFLKVNSVPSKQFGPKTKAALSVYQKNHGLVSDGIMGPRSQLIIEQELNNQL